MHYYPLLLVLFVHSLAEGNEYPTKEDEEFAVTFPTSDIYHPSVARRIERTVLSTLLPVSASTSLIGLDSEWARGGWFDISHDIHLTTEVSL